MLRPVSGPSWARGYWPSVVRQDGNGVGDSSPMSERWVNAVIEIRIPLEVAIDATSHERLEADIAALDQVEMPDSATTSCRWEVVEDGEPIGH
jgi:hypothetical protein